MDELFNYLIKSKLFIADPDEKRKIDWYWAFAIGILLTMCILFFVGAIASLIVGYDGEIFAACISAGVSMILVLSVVIVLFWTREGASKQMSLDDGKIVNGSGDVVVVPISGNPRWNVENKLYFCQKNRSFRESAKYIAFYNKKKVIGYGEKMAIDLSRAEELIKDFKGDDQGLSKYVSENPEAPVDYYELKKYKEISFEWGYPRVPVRKQQYITLDELDPQQNS